MVVIRWEWTSWKLARSPTAQGLVPVYTHTNTIEHLHTLHYLHISHIQVHMHRHTLTDLDIGIDIH